MLYRSNAQSRVLEHALFNAGMPYRVYGGLRFFERQEIKHALAYLRLVANPDDDGALARVINFPARGIGNRSLEQLQELAKASGVQPVGRRQARGRRAEGGGRREGEAQGDHPPFILILVLQGHPGVRALIEHMRDATKDLPLPETIEHVIEASGLKAHYRAEKEGADRLENLAELINAAATFVAERNVQPAGEAAGMDEPDELTAFLAHAALEAGEHQASAGADALQLMTVHSAKGLEFHSVFVSGLEEGLFPHENSLTEADGIEEERRLMYVALTRARRRLYLSFAQSRAAARPDALRHRLALLPGNSGGADAARQSRSGFRNQRGFRSAQATGHASSVTPHPVTAARPASPGASARTWCTPPSAPGVIVSARRARPGRPRAGQLQERRAEMADAGLREAAPHSSLRPAVDC